MLGLCMSLSLASQPAKALDPLTIVGAIASPVFCKLISCRSTETVVVYPDYQTKKFHREKLKQMRNDFVWEDFYSEGECKPFESEVENGTACRIDGQWRINTGRSN